MMYFFAGAGFHWESITGWDYNPEDGNFPASLKIQFKDRFPLDCQGKDAEQLNEFLKSKSIVLQFNERTNDELERLAGSAEQIINRFTKIVEFLEAAQSNKLDNSGEKAQND